MDLSVLELDELKKLADGLDVKYHPNIGLDNLRKKLDDHVKENPGCLGFDKNDDPENPIVNNSQGNTPEDPQKAQKSPEEIQRDIDALEEEKAAAKVAPENQVKIQAKKVRGIVNSSLGPVDFGDDGIAEVDSEVAAHFCDIEGYDKC